MYNSYLHATLIANSTTFVNVKDQKVKGILVSNSGSAGSATVHFWGATGGTFQTSLTVGASGSFILPIKVSGASTSGTAVSVYGLY
jgi:hypothetical protein